MRKVSLVVLGAVMGAATVMVGTKTRMFSEVRRAPQLRTLIAASISSAMCSRKSAPIMSRSRMSRSSSRRRSTACSRSLDPHSSYMDAKNFRDMQVQTRGEFGGLGIEVTQEDGLIKVVTPIDDTPASQGRHSLRRHHHRHRR